MGRRSDVGGIVNDAGGEDEVQKEHLVRRRGRRREPGLMNGAQLCDCETQTADLALSVAEGGVLG